MTVEVAARFTLSVDLDALTEGVTKEFKTKGDEPEEVFPVNGGHLAKSNEQDDVYGSKDSEITGHFHRSEISLLPKP